MRGRLCLFLVCLVALTAVRSAERVADRWRPGDHICIIGNTLGERLQHYGWLETLLYQRFTNHDLVFRNLGFSGDELTLRLRSADFGTPAEWLRRTEADVVWAFFGFNESFRGEAGLERFRRDLEQFIRETRAQDYSGRGPPRLVLFSPIAAERHRDRNFPDPTERNRELGRYTEAMEQIARFEEVPFVDLFGASRALYAEAARAGESLTVNGIHLSEAGYRALASVMFEAVVGEAAPSQTGGSFDRLRAAVLAKNAAWFSRYRTVDGYNVYGGRSHLEYGGVRNRDTMQREMEMREVMTANRDRRIWAVARGGDLPVADDNLPAPVEVASNKPGSNPDGTHLFLGGEEAIKRMRVPEGCRVNLFASEEQFPALANPVQMAFDARGRLWVAAWPNYPERTPWSRTGDSLLVFEDVDQDGRADRVTPFVEDLNAPTGFQFYRDGVILVQAPDVWFVRDTDGDDRADWRQRVLGGIDSADTHHTANALALDPGGAIYLSDGVFHRTQIETAWGPVRNNDAAIFRFEPRTGRFEVYIPYGFANPHGRVFDAWGNDLVTDATGNNTYFGPAISGRLEYPAKHPGIKEFWDRPSRPCPGTGLVTSGHFPDDWQGNFLNCNVIGFQGIFRVKVTELGSGLVGETLEPLIQSDDPNFRPSDVRVGPDGAIYFLDWHNPIIGHMQHHLRDPNRDHAHGRIYRVTYPSRPLLQAPTIAGAPILELLDLLKEPENDVRTRAKIELGARDTTAVLAGVTAWTRSLDPQDPAYEHHWMEALWVHQWHNAVNPELLRRMLGSPEPRARAAAIRVLCYWRDRLPEALELLRVSAHDPSPRARLEAVRAASFFEGQAAAEIVFDALQYETDYYLDYVVQETLRALKPSLAGPLLPEHPRAMAYLIERMSNAELRQMPQREAVLSELLIRPGLDPNTRNETLEQLARLRQSDRILETLAALRRLDRQTEIQGQTARDLGWLLAASPVDRLLDQRAAVLELARVARRDEVQRAAYAAVITWDGGPGRVWPGTAADPTARRALISALGQLPDPALRATFRSLLISILTEPQSSPDLYRAALANLPLAGSDHAEDSFDLVAAALSDGRHRAVAVRALNQLPREVWRADQAGPLAESILAWARTVPVAERTTQEYSELMQLGQALATHLPRSDALRLTAALHALSVRVLVVKTLFEQMRYDVTRLVVEAGKPFEIIFENNDAMPHNLVITTPGAREAIGLRAEKMPANPDRQGRLYVPRDERILAASRLLDPGETEVLQLTAPAEPGSYDYVCTYPEHWRVMFGQLLVVADAEAWVRASAQPPPPQTEAAGSHTHGVYE